MTKQEFIDYIKSLTVLELADLVHAVEEEFGVSAAATAVAVAGPAAAAEPVEEKTEFDVIQGLRRTETQRYQGCPRRTRPRPEGSKGSC